MKEMRQWSLSRGQLHSKNPRSDSGFSLVELMVAVTILSFLFLLAVPTYQRLQKKAKAAAVATDLRVFATALQGHAHEAGSWPAEVGPGVVPPGLTPEEFKYDDWTRTTPIGGKFDWEYNCSNVGGTYTAVIKISPTPESPFVPDDDLMEAIDQIIDDGDLDTGNFRHGFGGDPIFIIEK